MWTIEKVKKELPEVKVNLNGRVIKGNIRGRKNRFASVSIGSCSWEFAWATIVHSLNSNKPLII